MRLPDWTQGNEWILISIRVSNPALAGVVENAKPSSHSQRVSLTAAHPASLGPAQAKAYSWSCRVACCPS